MTVAQIFLITGVSLMGILGSLHLVYTFFSNKFDPYDPAIKKELKKTSLVINKNTQFWKAWVGFNASHSMGPILMAVFYLPLATQYNHILLDSIWLSTLPLIIGVIYLYLAKKYWFIVPTIGMSLATLCFSIACYLYNYL